MLIASGADYRRLPAEGCERYEGCGVYYAATLNEAPLCQKAEAVVIGGGNSAGQAAVFLSTIASKVYLIIRADDLYANMSAYLARRIEQTPNIEVLLNTTVRAMRGDNHLREIEIVNNETGEAQTLTTAAVFSFIGAAPRTNWLPPEIEKDAKEFVRTGAQSCTPPIGPPSASHSCWKRAAPARSQLETCERTRSSASPQQWARAPWR